MDRYQPLAAVTSQLSMLSDSLASYTVTCRPASQQGHCMRAGNADGQQDSWTAGLCANFSDQCLQPASNTRGEQAQAGHSSLALRADLRSMGSPGAGAASAAGVSSTSAPLVTSSLQHPTNSFRTQGGASMVCQVLQICW